MVVVSCETFRSIAIVAYYSPDSADSEMDLSAPIFRFVSNYRGSLAYLFLIRGQECPRSVNPTQLPEPLRSRSFD